MQNFTVIATNNGFDYLERALDAEQKYGRWPVVVFDTCSSDPAFEPWARKVCADHLVGYERLAEPRYDFGAYMMASQMFPEVDNFWFKHDSLYLKSPKFYDIIEATLPRYDMVAWHFFAKWGSSFDNEEQRQWLVDQFGSDDYDYGFYGPNFAIKHSTLRQLKPELEKVVVDSKLKQQAMERGWAILAKKYKMKTLFLENYKGDVKSAVYKYFIKATHQSGAPRE